ncbi:MAG TPA: hypothetical protein PLN21_19515 [Gemmatales bacterium]|nr:hypothetical protein [Gemmatales bacterium]
MPPTSTPWNRMQNAHALFADLMSQGLPIGAIILGVMALCVAFMGIIGSHIMLLAELRGWSARIVGVLALVAGVMLIMYGIRRM